jgi:hypothetical protein
MRTLRADTAISASGKLGWADLHSKTREKDIRIFASLATFVYPEIGLFR